jgi:hypothetical protein
MLFNTSKSSKNEKKKKKKNLFCRVQHWTHAHIERRSRLLEIDNVQTVLVAVQHFAHAKTEPLSVSN